MRGICTLLPLLIAALATPPSLPTLALAAEYPRIDVQVDHRILVDTVTSAQLGGQRAHLNFPFLERHSNGDLIAVYTVGQTQSGMQSARQAISNDGGHTWSQRIPVNADSAGAQLIRPSGQLSQAFGVYHSNPAGFTSWNNNGRYRSFDGGDTWDSGTDVVTYNTGGVAYTVMNHSYEDVLESGSTLYMAQFGQRLGTDKFESVLMVSTNGGKTWNRRSSIASHTTSLEYGAMGGEGPTETGLTRLDNGNLLAVFRTGQPFPSVDENATQPPLFWSISNDDGNNWSPAKSLGVSGVFPQLRKLDDGSVALTYGRYGAKVMFADPTGTRWTTPTIIHNGPTSGHTELRSVGSGKYVYVYDQSGFYPPSWNCCVPTGYVYDSDQSANLYAAILNIDTKARIEDIDWAVDYHGDVRPTEAAEPWVETSSGTANVHKWAELGQDFLRLETGVTGANNSISYALSGASAGSPWQNINFTNGAIIELRARVASAASSEGAASLLIGDGVNGHIALEFDGNSVNLEGIGGNGGQVELSVGGFAGFSPLAWQNYRLIVRPEDAGGDILAFLYLNGLAAPVLTQRLQPSAIDELRFGDLTGANNGTLELDYLRFAELPATGIWAGDRSGNWHDQNNWLSGTIPDGAYGAVLFGGAIAKAQTVIVDEDVQLERIRFNSYANYAIAGQGLVQLQSDAGTASIQVERGWHQFQAIVLLQSDAQFTIDAGASLAFNNRLDLNGHELTITGSGELEINNVLATGGGALVIEQAQLTGSGQFTGDLYNIAGTISPGNSPGRFEIVGDFVQRNSGRLRIEIAGLLPGEQYDVLSVQNRADLGGILEVLFVDNFHPSGPANFQILSASQIVGIFASLSLPALTNGLRWDLSKLERDGMISIASTVPESASASLALLALALFGGARHKRSRRFVTCVN